jgi:hypothetical protein
MSYHAVNFQRKKQEKKQLNVEIRDTDQSFKESQFDGGSFFGEQTID